MKRKIPCDSDWISVHGPNLDNPAIGCAEKEAEELKNEILNSPNTEEAYPISGTKYYFSSDGDDSNDGMTPETPLKSLKQISNIHLKNGDAVLLKRNSVFRIAEPVKFEDCENFTVGSYGEGEKPRVYASPKDYAVSEYWESTSYKNVWKTEFPFVSSNGFSATGIFFDHGKAIGSLRRSGVESLEKNFDFYSHTDEKSVYLYFDKGNPADFYKSIEIIPSRVHLFIFRRVKNAVLDNLCLKFTGGFPFLAIGKDITVTNCEMGYTGGLWNGQVRFGNAVELSLLAQNVRIENNWIYQIFDTALTWQCSEENSLYQNISFSNNLLEYNNADIEFYTRGASVVDNFRMENNIMRFTSMGWGTNDEETGPRMIEGCISAHSFMLDNIGLVTYKNNIMDCPARWVINWRDKAGRKSDVKTGGNKLYIKEKYRTTDVVLRGFAKKDESVHIEFSADNAEETKEVFKRFDKSIEVYWYD